MTKIAAIVLAAGLSRRMGSQKVLLPWKNKTVIETITQTILDAQIQPIHVIVGNNAEAVSRAISALNVSTIYNTDFDKGEMISSIQCGIKSLDRETDAVLIALGDQPQIGVQTLQQITRNFLLDPTSILIPTFQGRKGHPVLIPQKYFDEILLLRPLETLKTFMRRHKEEIRFLEVNSPDILKDLDTPEDYLNMRNHLNI